MFPAVERVAGLNLALVRRGMQWAAGTQS